VTTKLDSLDIIAQVIRDNYGLGRVDRPEPLEGAHQRRHRKLLVNTALGRFLAKTYKRDPYVLDALRFQHRLSEHLLKNGIPVARVQPTTTGVRIVELDTWALELQAFVEGESMQVSSDTLAISAQALGRFHESCRDFPRPERDAQMWRFSEVPRNSFSSLYEMAKSEGGDANVLNEQCNRIALFLRDAGDALSLEKRSRFETGLIHGDWHSGNLIYKDDRLMAVVDLEFAGDGCFLEDLSYAISNLCIRTTMKPDRLSKRTDILLDQYQRFRTLSFYEEAALYYAVGVKHIATVSYQIQAQGNLVAGFTAAAWMERLALQCGWLAERAQKIRWGK
jgi:Ser/Thr protein kinase RdoA (MazF antagonist)